MSDDNSNDPPEDQGDGDDNTTNKTEQETEEQTAVEDVKTVKAPSSSGSPPQATTQSTTNVTPPPSTDPATEAATAVMHKKSRKPESLGYGTLFPERLFERLQLKIDLTAGSKLRFQLTKSVIVAVIPDGSQAIGILEPGDWIRCVDGTNVESRRKVYSLLKQKVRNEPYSIVFNVKRPIRTVFLIHEKQINEYLPPALEILPGYSYLLGFVATYPGARIGLHIKSYENRVYVSSISHGSLAEVTFHIGDVILSVDDVAVASVTEAHKRIHDALKTKKWVQTVIERAETKVALQRMNVALKADRKLDVDPKMADDINGIVAKELRKMQREGNDYCKGILKNEAKSPRGVSISQTSKETPINCDPVNVKLLVKVPANRQPLLLRRRYARGQSRAFGNGAGTVRHLKTPGGISYTEFIPNSSSSTSTSSNTRSFPRNDK